MRFVIAGAVLVAVAMGVGRFAYTPLIPLMEREGLLTPALAGVLASSNLFGYLLGSLLAIVPALRERRLPIVYAAVVAVVGMTAAMAMPSPPAWIVIRFLTGVASGFVLIFAASIVIERAAAESRPSWPGIFFGGVGAGTALTGAVAAPLARLGGADASWLGLAAISALGLAATARWFTAGPAPVIAVARSPISPARRPGFRRLAALYGIQGFSYVIPATFLVALVSSQPATARFAAASWVVVGVVAAVSTSIWSHLARRFGTAQSLIGALLLQAAGDVVAVFVPTAFGVAFAAFALGATFMGLTVLGTGLARELRAERTSAAIAQITALYSVGQIVGPLVATALVLRTGSYHAALLCAGASTLVSAAIAVLLLV